MLSCSKRVEQVEQVERSNSYVYVNKDNNKKKKKINNKIDKKLNKDNDLKGKIWGDKQCIICLKDIKNNDNMRILSCRHTYHKECIDNWFKRKECCPVCNINLN